MNKNFEEPMIKVYNFRYHDIATEGLSGYEGNEGGGPLPKSVDFYNGNYITVQGGADTNVPL